MITVIILRGCGDSLGNPNSPPWWIANRLDPDRFEIQECPYEANIASTGSQHSPTGISLAEATLRAMPLITDMVRDTPNDVMFLTYSQGSYTAVEWLKQKPDDCVASYACFVANPLRREHGGTFDRDAQGFGIAGQRPLFPFMRSVIEVAHPEDGITSCPRDSRLRTVSDLVDPLSFALGGGWFQGLAEKTMRGDWQQVLTSWRPGMPLPDPGQFALRYWRDAQLVDGYLRTGKHGASYWTDGLLQRAVDHINQNVRE